MSFKKSHTAYQPDIFLDENRIQNIKEALPQLKALYKKYAAAYSIAGYSYAVLVDGVPLTIECEGYRDINQKASVTPQSVFRLASITKSFTAMAILKLRDEGHLKLEDPASLYVPELGGQKPTIDSPEITIADLLSHVGGFPEDNAWGDRQLEMTDSAFLSLLSHGIHFSTIPETAFEYSNLGYTLLGCIVTRVSGVSCQEYIAKNIWEPLGMHSATWDYKKVPDYHLVHGYKSQEKTWQKEGLLGDGVFAPMGGMLVSMEDFCKYVAFHQQAWPCRNESDTLFVKRSTVRSMHHPRVIGGSIKVMEGASGYGYGLRWDQDLKGIKYISHSGGLPGFGCNWVMLPDYGIAVIFLANVTYAPAFKANIEAIHQVVEKAKLTPRVIQPSLILKTRQAQLLEVLPQWTNAPMSECFASNFFLDNDINELKKISMSLFEKMGKIVKVGDLLPENKLRGEFIIQGTKSSLKIKFTLAPDAQALIQSVQMTLLYD